MPSLSFIVLHHVHLSQDRLEEILDILRTGLPATVTAGDNGSGAVGVADGKRQQALLLGRPGLTRPRASPMRASRRGCSGRARPMSELILELPARRVSSLPTFSI
jgi:hypothetical protein